MYKPRDRFYSFSKFAVFLCIPASYKLAAVVCLNPTSFKVCPTALKVPYYYFSEQFRVCKRAFLGIGSKVKATYYFTCSILNLWKVQRSYLRPDGISIKSLVSTQVCSNSFHNALTARRSFLVLCLRRFFLRRPTDRHIRLMAFSLMLKS